MTVKVFLPNNNGAVDDTVDAVSAAADILETQGFEVNRTRDGWRLLMFRKNESQWTQVYTGLTSKAKKERAWLRVAGPEEEYFPLTWR